METLLSFLRWSYRHPTLEYVLPENQKEIAWAEFRKDPRLKSVLLSPQLVSIGDRAFAHCPQLHSIEIPCPHLLHLGKAVFKGCLSLKHLDLSACKHVRHLPPTLLAKCERLESCVLPPYLETIGSCAFAGCIRLKVITFPNTLTTIKTGAFEHAISLRTLDFPASLVTIGDYAFAGCQSLKVLTFSDSNALMEVGGSAFCQCPQLKTAKVKSEKEKQRIHSLFSNQFASTIKYSIIIITA
jgi:hypothetical protein